MAEIKWVKLWVNMFDNPKVKAIRRMPEGNDILLIWIMLMTMAGRCNEEGEIFLTQGINYTSEMLAAEIGYAEETVLSALDTLRRFGMIGYEENLLRITNWEEYQNVDGMERVREQTRKRVQKCRTRKKESASGKSTDDEEPGAESGSLRNVSCNAAETLCNAPEEDKDIKNKKEEKENKKNTKRKVFVKPSVEEIQRYCRERENRVNPEQFLDYYEANGWKVGRNAMQDWKAAVRNWERGSPDRKQNPVPVLRTTADYRKGAAECL